MLYRHKPCARKEKSRQIRPARRTFVLRFQSARHPSSILAVGCLLTAFFLQTNWLRANPEAISPIPFNKTETIFREKENASTGNTGRVFLLTKGEGDRIIRGFDANKNDFLRIHGYGLTNGSAVRSLLKQDGEDAVLHFANGESVRILATSSSGIPDTCLQLELDRASLIETFKDDFNTFSWDSEGFQPEKYKKGTWRTNYGWGAPSAQASRSLGGEQQVYTDPGFRGPRGVPFGIDPFHLAGGVLEIWGEIAPKEMLPYIWERKYTSGLITSKSSFSQLYGVFEIRAKLPKGQGFFPAFWLLPEDRSWPPEIDVFEMLGHDTKTFYATVHSKATGEHIGLTSTIVTPDLSADFHQYAVSWQADEVRWYFDGVEVARTPTPKDMHKPMYVLANLAIGSNWPGYPDASTKFPGVLSIDWIRAYKVKPAGK